MAGTSGRAWAAATLAAALAAVCLAGCVGGAKEDRGPVDYLALGDSAPFGFRQHAPEGYGDADDFVGYPTLLADDRGLAVRDLSCPGETTASFLNPLAVSAACTNYAGKWPGYRSVHPLHSHYGGGQVDAALDVLTGNPGVELVTLQLGVNDFLICTEVTKACDTPDGVAAQAAEVRQNLDDALSALRDEGGYGGTIVLVNYFAYDYSDPAQTAAFEQLNAAIADAAAAHDAVVADAYEAFRSGSAANGGDVIQAGLVLPEDTHPTAAGQQLIATTVEQVL